MMDRYRLVAATATATAFASLLTAACGSYDNGPKGTGGSMASGGTGGATGGAGTGGTAGAPGGTGGSGAGTGGATGGSAGMAGAGAGSGGASGQAGSSGAGGAPTGGASGAGAGGADAGTGGGAGQAACVDAAPCGGDVVGTWTSAGCDMAVSGMANLTSAGIGCSSAPVAGSVKVTGTLTAVGDGTFMDNTTTTGEVVMNLAQQCLMISGFFGTCDRLDLEPAGFKGIMCVDDTTTMGCTCTVPIDQMGGLGAIGLEASLGNATSGTYTTADNKLVLTAAGQATEYPYCFAGSTLTLAPGTPTNLGTVAGSIVFQKQ
jgi:hypothetical protein